MKRAFLTLLVGALWLLPLSVSAADGDPCDSAQFTRAAGGLVRAAWCVILVDDETSASSATPVVFDLGSATGTKGPPHILSFQIGTDNDCTAGNVEFTSSEVSGGQEHDIGVDPVTSTNPVLSLTGSGNSRINVDVSQTSMGSFINTIWSGVSGCTGGFDVLLIGYEVK